MRSHLRAGIAIYNAGHYHAAHDAWEAVWLDLPEGDDERLLHGLIQFTAAVHHARNRNWSGTTGLAESAGEYLHPLPTNYRSVNLDEVRSYLDALAIDPERIERAPAPPLTHGGTAVEFADLDFDATAVTAHVLAEELEYNVGVIEDALEYARSDIESGEDGSEFVSMVFDFVREAAQRDLIVQRLGAHVTRRADRERDVDGLFDDPDDDR